MADKRAKARRGAWLVSVQIKAVSMDDICAEVVKATRDVLTSHGIERPAVVVNFAWKDPGDPHPYAVGTAIPRAYRRIMADSLRQSAEDATA